MRHRLRLANFGDMQPAESLSKAELLQLLKKQEGKLETQRSQLREQDIQLQLNEQKITELTQERDEYKLAFDKLLQQRFRNRSERYIDNPDQLRIDFGDTDEAADAAAGLSEAVEEVTVSEHRRRRRKGNDKLPEHLPRREVVADVPESVKNCEQHGERTLLPESMWDITETLVFSRPKLSVLVTKYPKYACPQSPECGIGSPERPTGLVEGNRFDASVAAEIITNKYAYHLPLYRLQDYFAGCGWTPSRSTQLNILSSAAFVVEPLLQFFKRTLQSDPWIGCDDTRLTLLYPKTLPPFDLSDPKERRIHEVFNEALAAGKPSINAKMWAYRGVSVKLNVFDFTVSRHRDGPELFFADYSGTLLGDCWNGFESIATASDGAILRAACNVHARRKFENSSAYPDESKRWLRWYQRLMDIETRGQPLSADERLELRQKEALPIWDEISTWLVEVKERTSNVILPKSDLGKAVQYVRNHLTELRRYLHDGMLPIDNNETEQLMRHVALGRKNWVFAGSVQGGERNAGFLTLASSAIRNDLDVWDYIKDVLDQLLEGSTDYESLLPWKWAESHPESIRRYRQQERKDRVRRKQARRAHRRKLGLTARPKRR